MERRSAGIRNDDGRGGARHHLERGDSLRQRAGRRFGHCYGAERVQERPPISQKSAIAAESARGSMFIAAEADRAFAEERSAFGGPAGGIEGVLDIAPQDRFASRCNGLTAGRERSRIERRDRRHGGWGRAGIDAGDCAFHVRDRAAVAGRLGGENLFELLEPGALSRAFNRRRRPVRHRRQRPHPRAQLKASQDPDERSEIAARAGCAGEVVHAGLRLVPVPRNRKLDRTDADRLEPDQLALPETARIEVVRKLHGLHVLAGRPGRPRSRRRVAAGSGGGSKRSGLSHPVVVDDGHANDGAHLE